MTTDKKLRVALAIHSNDPAGGIGRYVWAIASQLASAVDITMVTSQVVTIPPPTIGLQKIPSLPKPRFLWTMSFAFSAWLYFKRQRYDLVHVQGAAGFVQDIVTAHSCHKRWFQISRQEVKPWSTAWLLKICNPAHYLTIITETLQYHPRRHRRVIAVSQSIAKELQECYGVSTDRIDVVYNGVDCQKFNPQLRIQARPPILRSLGIDDDAMILVFVAHEFRRKGLATILQAMATLTPKPYLLVVGGDNAQPFLSAIQKLGLRDRVHFVGAVADVDRYFAAADVLVFPTQYEPFGLAIIEAMACALPVITSASAGAAELIKHTENGLLLQNHASAAELADNLQKLADKDLRKKIGDAARITAEQLSWEKQAAATQAIYQRVAREKGLIS